MASPARASSLADAIAAHAPLHCLGVYDGVSLAAAERAGASALYASGLALSASVLGLPDAGLMTQTEMHDAIARLVGQTDLPLVADADAGYGDAGNAARTMRLWERAGVAALHIEDQAFPKHCAQTRTARLVSADEMSQRLCAMVDARIDRSCWIIARTDAMPVEPLDSVLQRCLHYAAAGADALFINAPKSRPQFAHLAEALAPTGKPIVFNAVCAERTPTLGDAELHALGVRLVLHPVDGVAEAARRLAVVYRALMRRRPASSAQALRALARSIEQPRRPT
jgi:2-methylisocitrate lyase-like PEP mutase family enzyme